MTPNGPLHPSNRYDKQHRRLCTATRTDGEPCNGPAMDGQRVCRTHGGATPQARRAARIRLAALTEPAIVTHQRLMLDAENEAVQLRAAESILDRTGYPRGAEVTINNAQEALRDRLLEIRDQKLADTHPDPNPDVDVDV